MNAETPMSDFKPSAGLIVRESSDLGSRAITVICYAGLGVANYYSWTMTATGFLETKLLPDNVVMAASLTPFLVAGFVQLGILCFYLSLARFKWRKTLLYILAGFMVTPLIALTILFSLYAVTFTSEGDKLVAHRNVEIEALRTAIPEADAAITAAYGGYLESLRNSRQQACLGLEGSGVARCGRNAEEFAAAAIGTANEYQSSLGTEASPIANGASPSETAANIAHAYETLAGKFAAYEKFAQEKGQSTAVLQSRLNDIKQRVARLKAGLTSTNADKSGIVLDQVIDGVGKFFQLRGDPRFNLKLVIALLPDFLSWLFSILLIIVRPAGASDMPSEGELRRKTKIWRRLSELSKEQYAAWRAWADEQMKWRVEREVHKSFEDSER